MRSQYRAARAIAQVAAVSSRSEKKSVVSQRSHGKKIWQKMELSRLKESLVEWRQELEVVEGMQFDTWLPFTIHGH